MGEQPLAADIGLSDWLDRIPGGEARITVWMADS